MAECVCSLPKILEVKQYSSITRERDPSLAVSKRKTGRTKYNASLFAVASYPSAMAAETDTKLECSSADGLVVVTQDVLLSALVCPSQ